MKAAGRSVEAFATPIARAPRLSELVADQLLETITSRPMRPGDRLSSARELAAQFGVSRAVIREATRILITKGVIEVRAGARLTVATANPAAVTSSMGLYLRRQADITYDHVHAVRAAIEVEIAVLAAEHATDGELEELRATHEHHITVRHDLEACSLADVEFHRILARLTHNRLFLVLLDSIGDVLIEIRRLTVVLPGNALEGIQAHGKILECVLARNGDGARKAMVEHLDGALRSWERVKTEAPLPPGALVQPPREL